MFSFVKDLQKNGSDIVELCSGALRDGRMFHAFIKMTPDNYMKYQEALKLNIALDLPSFGDVIHTGWGDTPDAATKERIMRGHTDNHKIKEELTRHAKAMMGIIRKNTQGEEYDERAKDT
jgi:hypothetical protein